MATGAKDGRSKQSILGIDLGTTNSLAAIWQDGEARLIPNSLGEFLTPSVVGLDDDGSVLVGQAAKERLISHSELTAANFKRHMAAKGTYPLGERRFPGDEAPASSPRR